MTQLNLKLSEEEYEVLKYYSRNENLPLASAFRTIIHEPVDSWRLNFTIQEYCRGKLGFKKAWKMSGVSFNQWLKALEQSGLELEIPEIIEEESEKLAQSLDLKDFLKRHQD